MDKKSGIAGIYLHGSRATGTYNDNSDYDLTIVTKDMNKLDIKRETVSEFTRPKKNIHNIFRSQEMIPLYDPDSLLGRFHLEVGNTPPNRIESMIKMSEQLKELDMNSEKDREKLGREIERAVCMIMGTSDINEAKAKYINTYFRRHGRLASLLSQVIRKQPTTEFPNPRDCISRLA